MLSFLKNSCIKIAHRDFLSWTYILPTRKLDVVTRDCSKFMLLDVHIQIYKMVTKIITYFYLCLNFLFAIVGDFSLGWLSVEGNFYLLSTI